MAVKFPNLFFALNVGCLLCFSLLPLSVFSQYTNVINSNRPGFSESPYGVGTGVFQLESSMFFRKKKKEPTFGRPESSGMDFLFRTSIFSERLELNLNLAAQKEQIYFQNVFNSSYFKTHFSKLTVGGKYLVYEQKYTDKSKEIRSWVARNSFDYKRLVPSIAVQIGINTRVPSPIFKTNNFSARVALLFQNNLSEDFNIITNFLYDYIGTGFEEFSFIATATYNLNGKFSSFIENNAILSTNRYQSDIASGIAFLCNRNLQINSSLRFLVDEDSSGFYASVGACYRLDGHMDKMLKGEKESLFDEEEPPAFIKRKSFLGKILNRTTNFFKNNKRQVSKKAISKLNQNESIQQNTNSNQHNTVDDHTEVSSLKIDTKNDQDKDAKKLKKEIKKLEKEIRKEKRKLEKEKRKIQKMTIRKDPQLQ